MSTFAPDPALFQFLLCYQQQIGLQQQLVSLTQQQQLQQEQGQQQVTSQISMQGEQEQQHPLHSSPFPEQPLPEHSPAAEHSQPQPTAQTVATAHHSLLPEPQLTAQTAVAAAQQDSSLSSRSSGDVMRDSSVMHDSSSMTDADVMQGDCNSFLAGLSPIKTVALRKPLGLSINTNVHSSMNAQEQEQHSSRDGFSAFSLFSPRAPGWLIPTPSYDLARDAEQVRSFCSTHRQGAASVVHVVMLNTSLSSCRLGSAFVRHISPFICLHIHIGAVSTQASSCGSHKASRSGQSVCFVIKTVLRPSC